MAALALAGCGEPAPNDYPAAAQTSFHNSCPATDEMCVCTWDRITRTLSYEDYQAALERFRVEGLMDPRITSARTYCLEHNPG